MAEKEVVRVMGLGQVLATTISWSLHKSLLWAIFQGFLGWLYVLYYWWTKA